MATVVLDNGAFSAKIGYSTDKEARSVPNCVIKAKNVRNRIFIGDQVDDCKDLSGLYYLLAFQKGYLVNWDIERQVWDHLFGKDGLKVNCEDSNLIVTEPYFNFTSIQEAMNEIFFEEYQFKSLLRCNAGLLSQHKTTCDRESKPLCCLVVDTGFSFTHIIPYYNGKKVMEGVKRINVGGKILTNHLKEVISYRQLMVMDETYVMNQVKEDVCFASTDFQQDTEIARKKGKDNTVAQDYILPDYTHIKRGYARPIDQSSGKAKGQEQIIRMNNERFAIPEVLFHPSDIGIQEMGIPEAIHYAISCTPEEMHPHLYDNIILTGGNCMLPGFRDRVYKDVRCIAPALYDVTVGQSANPVTYAWEGGCLLAQSSKFSDLVITRDEYDEHGHNICFEKFSV